MINNDQSHWNFSPKPILFFSTDPAMNLALEQCLFEHYEPGNRSILIFYANCSSVIIGKHQNPWYEADIQWLEQEDIPLIRRMSGGGTVVHDLGNLNYSFFCDKKTFDQKANLEFLAYILTTLGIDDLEITDRGDILLHGYKISGNALWYRKETVMHHGTLLLNSDLARLQRALQGLKHIPNVNITGHWVDSKPRAVGNIKQFFSHINAEVIINQVQKLMSLNHSKIESWNKGFKLSSSTDSVDSYLHELSQSDRFSYLLDQYQSWEWNYAKTPRFECQLTSNSSLQDTILVIEKGMIQNQKEVGQNLDRFLGLPTLNSVFFTNHGSY